MQAPLRQPIQLPQQVPHYASHLGAVNESNPVESTEDILNDRGVLVVRSGTRIDTAVSKRLLRHRLAKPLHCQVNLRTTLGNMDLLRAYEGLYTRWPDVKALMEGAGLAEQFRETVAGTPLPIGFRQHLTVMQSRLPRVFDKGLFCALLAYALSEELGVHAASVRAGYLAGLFHDAGLLHVPPSFLYQSGPLTPAQWQVLQEHPRIGHQLLIEFGHRVPPLTPRAVLEHHERCDGSGYPNAHGADKLHYLGQIVGLADSLQTIRNDLLQNRGLNLANSVPYLQANAGLHFAEITRVMRRLLRRCGLRPAISQPQADPASRAGHLLLRIGRIETLLEPLEDLGSALEQGDLMHTQPGIVSGVQSVLSVLHSAGLATPELNRWLASVAAGDAEAPHAELDTLELLQEELNWQLYRLRRSLDALRESLAGISDPVYEPLQRTLAALPSGDEAGLDHRVP